MTTQSYQFTSNAQTPSILFNDICSYFLPLKWLEVFIYGQVKFSFIIEYYIVMNTQKAEISKLRELREFLVNKGQEADLQPQGTDLTHIEVLNVRHMNITQAQMIRDSCKNLRRLLIEEHRKEYNWKGSRKSDEETDTLRLFEVLSTYTQLVDLNLQSSLRAYQIKGLHLFTQLKHLRMFDSFHGCKQGDLLPGLLLNLPMLESLGKLRCFSEERVLALKGLKYLRELQFLCIQFPPEEMKTLLSNLPDLTSIAFYNGNLKDKDIEIISENMQALESLSINYCHITSKGLKCLEKYQTVLRKLDINTYIMNEMKSAEIDTDYICEFLAGFKVLTELRMVDQEFSKQIGEAIGHLNLEAFQMKFPQTDDIHEFLRNTPTLKHFKANNYTNKTPQVIYESGANLKTLELQRHLNCMKDSGFCYMSKFKELKRLDMSMLRAGEVGINKIIRNLSNAQISTYSHSMSKKVKRNRELLQFNGQMRLL